MPTSYSTLLGLALPVTGELSGTWGDEVNNYITQYLDSAVAGVQTISGSQTAVTLSRTTNAALSQAGSGSTGSSQYQIINCTGNPASALTITVPSTSKVYVVLNNTSTNQTVTVKPSAAAGVTVAAARAALIAWNGTDFELVATDDASKMNGVLAAVNGGTGQSSYAVGDILYASTTTALSKLADVATGNALISGGVGVAPSYGKIGLTTHVSGTLPVANGGTGLTSGTSGGVLGFTATGTIASSAALAANAIVIGGGAGATPTTTTTGTGVVTAIGNAVNTTGGLVTQSGTLAASSLLLGGGASTAISSTTTGTGVVTALGTAVGSAGAFVVNGGALGTPSSGTVTNLTGTASININGTVGATTPNTGAFTSVTSTSASGILTRAAASQDGVELIGRAGGTLSYKVSITPTTLTASRTVTLPDANIDFTTGLAVANGGTGSTTASGARTNLGATTVGGNFFTLTNPSAITFPRINADNTVSALDAATFRSAIGAGTGSGTVTSVSWTGGIVSVGTATTTPAFTIAGTSGGIPYFSSASTWASSGALAANAIVLGGGAGLAPATTTTGTGVVTAIGNAVNTTGGLVTQSGTLAASSLLLGGGASTAITSTTTGTGVVTALGTNVGSAGAFVVNGGALGTPSSGTVTNLTGTASININGTVGATTPSTGAFTTLTSTGASSFATSSGSVGIGTSSPATKLDVSVSGGMARVGGASGNNLFQTYTGSTGAGIWAGGITRLYTTGGFTFSTGATLTTSTPTGYTDSMVLDSSGNLGLGVTPSAWRTSEYKAVQVGIGASFYGRVTSGDEDKAGFSANAFYDQTDNRWEYIATDSASRYDQLAGGHYWYTAPSGTAGNAISFTQAMTLSGTSDAVLLLGTTSPAYSTAGRGLFEINGSSTAFIAVKTGDTARGYFAASSSITELAAVGASQPLVFTTNAAERARITSVGNLSLGGTADRGTTVGTNAIQIFNGTAPAGTLTNGVSLYSSSGDLNFMNSSGNGFKVGYRNLPAVGTKTTSYTLATGDVGKYVQVGTSGSITIPDATFAEGDAITIFNNTTGNITITCSITTAYIAGTDTDKATMTLATRGVATILFISSTVCVVTGNVT